MGLHAPTSQAWRELGARLGQERVTQGVTQEFLAHWLGIDRRAVARVEGGSPRTSAAHLAAIEAALSMDPGASLQILAGVQPVRYRLTTGVYSTHSPTLVDLSQAPTLCGHSPSCRSDQPKERP